MIGAEQAYMEGFMDKTAARLDEVMKLIDAAKRVPYTTKSPVMNFFRRLVPALAERTNPTYRPIKNVATGLKDLFGGQLNTADTRMFWAKQRMLEAGKPFTAADVGRKARSMGIAGPTDKPRMWEEPTHQITQNIMKLRNLLREYRAQNWPEQQRLLADRIARLAGNPPTRPVVFNPFRQV